MKRGKERKKGGGGGEGRQGRGGRTLEVEYRTAIQIRGGPGFQG